MGDVRGGGGGGQMYYCLLILLIHGALRYSPYGFTEASNSRCIPGVVQAVESCLNWPRT